MTKPMRVLILHDPVSSAAHTEEHDTLVQVNAVESALKRLGCTVDRLAFSHNPDEMRVSITGHRADVIFNLVESLRGQGHLIHLAPGLLEDMGVAFTGASQAAMLLTSNKLVSKQLLTSQGLPTPGWIHDEHHCIGPWIIKSVWEDASLGLDDNAVVYDKSRISSELYTRKKQFGGDWFAESYIAGREFNLSLIESDGACFVLPIAEICFEDFPTSMPNIVGYKAKWDAGSFEYNHTVRRFNQLNQDSGLSSRLIEIAIQCWKLFGLRGYARVDFRVDAQGHPWILEVNANPCLSPDAGFAAALEREGMPYDTAIATILATAA